MPRKTLAALFLLVLPLAGYLAFAPVPVEPQAWNAPRDEGYTGPYAENSRLANLQPVSLGTESGPEHVAIGPDGMLYVAVEGGKILRMKPDGSAPEVWAETGGRVLGFDFDSNGNLIGANAVKGLIMIDARSAPDASKKITVLADTVHTSTGDSRIGFADAVVVARDGKMYFTDASTRFDVSKLGGFEASILDIMEHAKTGRVLVYDPAKRQAEVVADGLSFANGIALSEDQQSLFVAETGEYRIWKLPASVRNLKLNDDSAHSGQAKVILANLPGYPDNLMRGQHGRIWVGLAKPRSATADQLAAYPSLRKVALRLPRALWPVPRSYGHVLAFDESGKVSIDLQDPSGSYPETTGVTETADRLYIQSLHAPLLGWLPKGGNGL